jgi:SAM-dependent methyltransferase
MKIIDASKDALKETGLHKPVLKLLSSRHRRRDAVAQRVISVMEKMGVEKIRQKHAKGDPSCGKYLDLQRYVPQVVGDADRLDLLESRPIRVLDIGCGAGYFLFTLKTLGHDVLGIDLPDTELYTDMTRFLGIPRLEHRVVKYQPLPDLGGPVDLITAFAIVFDLHTTPEIWGPAEWKFLIDDCRSRLRLGGRIFFNFNPGKNPASKFVSDDVATMLRSLPGSRLSASKEFFTLTAMAA